jgi:hypothetical protein
MSHENVEVVRETIDGIRRGDWDAVAETLDPHIFIRTDPSWPEQYIYGRDAAIVFYRGWRRLSEQRSKSRRSWILATESPRRHLIRQFQGVEGLSVLKEELHEDATARPEGVDRRVALLPLHPAGPRVHVTRRRARSSAACHARSLRDCSSLASCAETGVCRGEWAPAMSKPMMSSSAKKAITPEIVPSINAPALRIVRPRQRALYGASPQVTAPAMFPIATWTSISCPASTLMLTVATTTFVSPETIVHVPVWDTPPILTVNTSLVPPVGFGPEQ